MRARSLLRSGKPPADTHTHTPTLIHSDKAARQEGGNGEYLCDLPLLCACVCIRVCERNKN